MADLHHRHHVQGVVEPAVTSPRQPMANHLAAGGLQRRGAGVGGEVVLAREPTDVTDLTEEPGGQHRPDPKQLHQAGVGPGDRRRDARLHRLYAPVQVAHVGDEVGGDLVAGDRRRSGGSDRGEQGGGAPGGEVTAGAAWDQVHQQPVQPVDGLGAHGHQVLTPVGQQVQHHRLVLDTDRSQLGSAAGGDGDRDRVVGVALAAMSPGQDPHPSGQLGRHVHHRFPVGHQPLGERPADPCAPSTAQRRSFHRPAH
jgi:hypothetical protein